MAGKHLESVISATSYLEKMTEYINVGMDNVFEIADDLAQLDPNNPELASLKQQMREYCKMDKDLRAVLKSVEHVKIEDRKNENTDDEEKDNLLTMFNNHLDTLMAEGEKEPLEQHARFVELNKKIEEYIPTEASSSMASEQQSKHVDEDLVISQVDVSTKCPYLGTEMKDPVKNKHCGHSYERSGILDLIKKRNHRARCPVSGCRNQNLLSSADLSDNIELKRFIQQKNKMEKRYRKQ